MFLSGEWGWDLPTLKNETERLPCGKRTEGVFASSVRSEQRTTASTGTVRADTRNLP